MGQQSGSKAPDTGSKAPDSEEREYFIASASMSGAFFCKIKIDKIFVDFHFAKTVYLTIFHFPLLALSKN